MVDHARERQPLKRGGDALENDSLTKLFYGKELPSTQDEVLGISSPTISAKPVEVEAASQPWILAGRTIVVADAHGDHGKRFVPP
jgi:hypothetical protein